MVKIFIANAPEDNDCSLAIQKGLAILRRKGSVEFFDQQNSPTGDRMEELRSALASSDIALLILSNNFIASDECFEMEKKALELTLANQLKLIPILYNNCEWKESDLGKYQALPRNQKFITNWPNQDVAFTEITREISMLVKHQEQAKTSIPDSQEIKRLKLDFDQLRMDLGEDQLAKVIDPMINATKGLATENSELLALKAQYTNLMSKITGNRIETNASTVEKNRIIFSLLSIIADLEKKYT